MLVDLLMPGMDGCDLARRFRQMPVFSQTRIVAITGQKGDEHKSTGMKAGFDAVLAKPASLTEIRAVLASVVVSGMGQTPKRNAVGASVSMGRRLPIDEAPESEMKRNPKP